MLSLAQLSPRTGQVKVSGLAEFEFCQVQVASTEVPIKHCLFRRRCLNECTEKAFLELVLKLKLRATSEIKPYLVICNNSHLFFRYL